MKNFISKSENINLISITYYEEPIPSSSGPAYMPYVGEAILGNGDILIKTKINAIVAEAMASGSKSADIDWYV